LRNVGEVAVHSIVSHHGDDLVVGLAAIGQAPDLKFVPDESG
jgi:hypothetical protein